MASTMADVAILDRVIAGGGAIGPANLKEVRIGMVAATLANLDGDTDVAFHAAVEKLKSAGVTAVDVDMPKLAELNGQVGFPVALYEAYDDMVAYLKHTGTGITIEQLAKSISSPDVKGTYDGLVIPRKLPGPNNTVADAKPAYEAAVKTARPALQALYRDTFAKNHLDAIAFPDHAEGRDCQRSPTRAASKILSCSSRTRTPAAMRESPASRSRSRWELRANCRSDWSSMAPREAIGAWLRSEWRWKGFSDDCRRRRATEMALYCLSMIFSQKPAPTLRQRGPSGPDHALMVLGEKTGDAASAAYAELSEHALDVRAHGRDLDAEPVADFLVAQIVGNHLRDFQFAHRKAEHRHTFAQLRDNRFAAGAGERAGEGRFDQP